MQHKDLSKIRQQSLLSVWWMKSLWSKNSTEKVVPEILVEIKGVQQQTNSVDCGLFAIATSLAFGKDTANVTYDSMKLPMHLVKCRYKNRWLASQKAPERVSQNVSPG